MLLRQSVQNRRQGDDGNDYQIDTVVAQQAADNICIYLFGGHGGNIHGVGYGHQRGESRRLYCCSQFFFCFTAVPSHGKRIILSKYIIGNANGFISGITHCSQPVAGDVFMIKCPGKAQKSLKIAEGFSHEGPRLGYA